MIYDLCHQLAGPPDARKSVIILNARYARGKYSAMGMREDDASENNKLVEETKALAAHMLALSKDREYREYVPYRHPIPPSPLLSSLLLAPQQQEQHRRRRRREHQLQEHHLLHQHWKGVPSRSFLPGPWQGG